MPSASLARLENVDVKPGECDGWTTKWIGNGSKQNNQELLQKAIVEKQPRNGGILKLKLRSKWCFLRAVTWTPIAPHCFVSCHWFHFWNVLKSGGDWALTPSNVLAKSLFLTNQEIYQHDSTSRCQTPYSCVLPDSLGEHLPRQSDPTTMPKELPQLCLSPLSLQFNIFISWFALKPHSKWKFPQVAKLDHWTIGLQDLGIWFVIHWDWGNLPRVASHPRSHRPRPNSQRIKS